MQIETFGFEKVYGIDIGTSIYLYNQAERSYEREQCFNNAFKCLGNNMRGQNNRAIFGYVLSTDGIRRVAVRHAWNSINNIYVDMTMVANGENPISVLTYSYLPVREYNATEFLEAIERNNGFPCLPKDSKEYYYIRELKKKGFEVLE